MSANHDHRTSRREFLRAGAATAALGIPGLQLWPGSVVAQTAAQTGDTLTIAYNVSPPSWDPNTGPSSVSPGLSSIFRTAKSWIGPIGIRRSTS